MLAPAGAGRRSEAETAAEPEVALATGEPAIQLAADEPAATVGEPA
jgi:hypothetical protein